jgi:acetoin:2,6-dichlorophenolindophenol oxidoreductase subunit beta
MREIRYSKAISEAIEIAMENNPEVFIMGEDVRASARGLTIGFVDKFGPDRVIDTPISEQGFHGCAIGAAMMGFRPILEYQVSEFVFFAFEQLVDQAQKFHYISGGKVKVPITILVPASGAIGSTAGQHSDHAYPYLLHAGMKVLLPSTPYDAKGLISSAIADDDPVVIFLPQKLLPSKGEVPEEEYKIPIGVGEIKRQGSDITVVATGHLVPLAIKAGEDLEKKGISLEVLDPRTLLPLDKDLIIQSVSKTGRAIIFDDSNRTCGFAAEVSAILSEECFSHLKKPILRVTRPTIPIPFSPPMEEYVLPDEGKLVKAVLEMTGNLREKR